VVGVLPGGESVGIKGELAGQQAGLGGDAKSSMLWSFFIGRT